LFSVLDGGLGDNLRGVDWLLNNLLDNWLLNNLLDNLGGLVNNLSFDCLVLDSFNNSFLRNIFNDLVVVNLGNVFSLVFNGVVVSHFSFLGNVFSGVDWLLDSFVFDFGSFIRNVLNSGFSSDGLSERLLNNLNGLLNDLNGLLNNLNGLLNDLNWLLDESWLDPRLLDVSDLRSGGGEPGLVNGLGKGGSG